MKFKLFVMGFRHRLTGNMPPGEFQFALNNSLYDYLRGWHFAKELFGG